MSDKKEKKKQPKDIFTVKFKWDINKESCSFFLRFFFKFFLKKVVGETVEVRKETLLLKLFDVFILMLK